MTAVLLAMLLSSPLVSTSFERPAAEAQAFVAPAEKQDRASLWFISREELTIYPGLRPGDPLRIPLTPAISAVDVFDIDGDASMDVLLVEGDRIQRHEIVDGQVRGPETLFEHASLLSDVNTDPFLHALAVPVEGKVMIALPTESGLELLNLDGTLHQSYPVGAHASPQVIFGAPFTQWSSTFSTLGDGDALEFRVSRVEAFKPRLPEDALPWPVATPVAPGGGHGRTRNPEDPPEDWPYFPLTLEGTSSRAAWLTTGPEGFETLIRVSETTEESALAGGPVSFGPARRYPGRLVLPPDTRPDFNQDGFVDILLWQTNRPGLTVDALTRAATGVDWPLFLSVHLYDPEKQRYAPRASGRVKLEVPVAWFLSFGASAPVQHVVLEDFDGDGATDLGLSAAQDTYTIWRYREGGFPDSASLTVPLSEPLMGIAFRTPTPSGAGILLGLETKTRLYVVRAQP